MSDVEHLVSSLGEEQRRATDEATLRRGLALARRLQLAHGRGVELQERGDHLVYSSVCVCCVCVLCVYSSLSSAITTSLQTFCAHCVHISRSHRMGA